ncbi:MAG: hypothetical protein AABW72_04750 [archaeon]
MKLPSLLALLIIFLLLLSGCTKVKQQDQEDGKDDLKDSSSATANSSDNQQANEDTQADTNISATDSGKEDPGNNAQSEIPNTVQKKEILIGVEYAMPGIAKEFSKLGIKAVKYYPDAIAWDNMQPFEDSEINFKVLDGFVTEFQEASFTDLVVALKSRSKWASKGLFNPTPKKEFVNAYKKWVNSVVERYDKDGIEDMPSLKYPVKYYEIGTEFSSYEPETAEEYLEMLGDAYKAAHSASDTAIVLHAAFLVTTAFKDNPSLEQYESAFNTVDTRIMKHSYSDIKKILDKPEFFDAINFHSLGYPYETEDTIKWLNYEMEKRSYKKPVIISDTLVNGFIGWGIATKCTGTGYGILIKPAINSDRCRLATYFKNLIAEDKEILGWTYKYHASDIVKRVIIAAEQGIELINIASTEDLDILKTQLMQASAGSTAWSGMADVTINIATGERAVNSLRPSFFALQQLASSIKGYSNIEKIPVYDNPEIKLYKFTINNKPLWIAWLETGKLILPEDAIPETTFALGASKTVKVEQMQTSSSKDTEQISPKDGKISIKLTPYPVYVWED